MMDIPTDIASRLEDIVLRRFGRVEEQLMASGLVDSMQVVELALMLEQCFGLPPDSFVLEDMRTLASLGERIHAIRRAQPRECTP